MIRSTVVLALAVVVATAACAGSPADPTKAAVTAAPGDTAPTVLREMRGLWIATVANIDWPSRTTLTADQQRAELTDILDRTVAAGLNAAIFQVRPSSDAVYNSTLEPWASLLTGTQGSGPGYDPLSFATAEAHARGLELHAWINPFRVALTASDSVRFAATQVFKARRDLVRVYGSMLWLDPGERDAQDWVVRVVTDIVRRYDIDAIHADDYFYPYQVTDAAGRVIDFPDSATYAKSASTLSRADWRRANVDQFVERLYREVHAIKPAIKVGISPFGIWRPGNPAGVQGLDAYATIYADSRKWLQQGWVDYLAPQLYWAISAPQQSYPALLDWWIAQSAAGRHVWPGLASYKVGASGGFGPAEIADQITLTRTRPAGTGALLYNTTATLRTSGGAVAASIAPLYATRALIPASPWLDATTPLAPIVSVAGSVVQMTPASGQAVRWWVVRWQSATNGPWTTRVLFGDQRSIVLDAPPVATVINAVSAAGNLSAPAKAP